MDTRVIDTLKELVAVEQHSLCLRLDEARVFVSDPSAGDYETLRRVLRETHEHCGWLAELIMSLGGVPGLRSADANSGQLHYIDFRALLPRVRDRLREVIDACKLARERVAGEQRADDLVSRIISRHQKHLGLLESLAKQP